MVFADYLQLKARKMIPWNGTYTTAIKDDDELHSNRGFLCLAIYDQLFAVLIRLRRGLEAIDVCIRFGISESTYSRMFATWVIFFVKGVKVIISVSIKATSFTVDATIIQKAFS